MIHVHSSTLDSSPPSGGPKREVDLIILFDGVCVLCHRTVQFLLDKDRKRIFRFAPLQGETAKGVLDRHPEINNSAQSVILIRHYDTASEIVFQRSEAMFGILQELEGFWRVVSWLRFIPVFIRDWLYNWIAGNRYRWFGKYAECRMPAPEIEDRFLP